MKSKYGRYLTAERNGVVNANRVRVGPSEKWWGITGRYNLLETNSTTSLSGIEV